MSIAVSQIRLAIIPILIVILSVGCSTKKRMSNVDAESEIRSVMQMQETAWSAGDIPQFMEGYWKSAELSFVGKSGINKGWQTTLDNYEQGYPNQEAMGQLTFEILEMNRISVDAYHMIGRYTLVRAADQPTGLFTLIWKYIDGQWLIISDHTSG